MWGLVDYFSRCAMPVVGHRSLDYIRLLRFGAGDNVRIERWST